MTTEVFQLDGREEFCRCAAELLGAAGAEAVAARGRFLLVLTGGRTVQPIYRHLASGVGSDLYNILTSKTFFFWGDERWVPATHPDSNQGLARRLLLDSLAVPEKRLRPVATGLSDPVAGARAYEQSLQGFFAGDLSPEGWPVFDLILLGLGPDGHVASLFPNSTALAEPRHWVSKVSMPELNPRVARVTLTMPVLNQARLVVVLAAGGERMQLARRIIDGEPDKRTFPAAGLQPAGRLVWLLAEGN